MTPSEWSGVTRRRWLRDVTVAVAAASNPLMMQCVSPGSVLARPSKRTRGGGFVDGVCSGDPGPAGVTLWCRMVDVPAGAAVTLHVAEDRGFSSTVRAQQVALNSRATARVRVEGLQPHHEYWYRFEGGGAQSEVGRFRTLPPVGSSEPIRFAVFSCQDYEHGFYTAHRALAGEDLDFVLCLGDYIYAEAGPAIYASGPITGTTSVRKDPVGLATTLAGYRAKYSAYRADPDLRAVHRAFPMIATWDDHEVQDDYFSVVGTSRRTADERRRSNARRRRAAYRAYFENMPTFPIAHRRLYRAIPLGGLGELFLLDCRQYRERQPCHDAVASPGCADLGAPRTLLGSAQRDEFSRWLASPAGGWKLIGNPVMMMPARLGPKLHYNFDSWEGYPTEREAVLDAIPARRAKDVVFLTGDIHTFIAGEVRRTSGEVVGREFVCGSITSAGLGELTADLGDGFVIKGNDRHPATPDWVMKVLQTSNPWIEFADFDHHGYGVVELTPTTLDVRLVRVATIKKRRSVRLPDQRWSLPR